MRQRPVLSAFISFSGPTSADTYVDVGPGYEGLDDYRLLFQFYAKSMYNLGPAHNAPLLRDHMQWAAAKLRTASESDSFAVPDVTGGHFALAEVGRDVVACVGAFLKPGRHGSRYIMTEYQTPSGQEEYYAHIAVLAYLQALLNVAEAWGNLLIVAAGLEHMNSVYSAGRSSWHSIPGILSVSGDGLHAGLQATADEARNRTLPVMPDQLRSAAETVFEMWDLGLSLRDASGTEGDD